MSLLWQGFRQLFRCGRLSFPPAESWPRSRDADGSDIQDLQGSMIL